MHSIPCLLFCIIYIIALSSFFFHSILLKLRCSPIQIVNICIFNVQHSRKGKRVPLLNKRCVVMYDDDESKTPFSTVLYASLIDIFAFVVQSSNIHIIMHYVHCTLYTVHTFATVYFPCWKIACNKF